MDSAYDLVILGGGIVGIWSALRARKAGLRVAILEIGPSSLVERQDSRPPLQFPERVNEGAISARNHVLTGNSAYWGGALARNPSEVLSGLFGSSGGAQVEAFYEEVEAQLGIQPGSDGGAFPYLEDQPLWEVVVLPGRRRGLWSEFLAPGTREDEDIRIFDRAHITDVDVDDGGRLRAIQFTQADGEVQTLSGRWFSLSMGVIDSIHFVQRFLGDRVPSPWQDHLGQGLHDHWSIPLAKVRWKNQSSFQKLFPPKFARGGIVGRRVPLQDGFFHLTADYDSMPPFDRVKRFLALRQQGGSLMPILGAGLFALARPWSMARAGLHYLAHRELRVPDGEEITLTLDFESAAHPENRLVNCGTHLDLFWDIRAQDEVRFMAILKDAKPWFEAKCRHSKIRMEWLVPTESASAQSDFLRAKATDTFHLGGGLQPSEGQRSLHQTLGSLPGCPNLLLNSTAAFNRPGPANPVLTLLARANQLVDGISRERHS